MSAISAMTIKAAQISQGGLHILYDAALIDAPVSDFFDIDHWRGSEDLVREAQGRAAACIFRYHEYEFVLRHYRRGGLMAKLSNDRYQWSGLEKTRAWREWHLLAEMFAQGLPVPRPVAARVQRHGLFYSADLVTLCLPDVKPLADVLMQSALEEAQWQLIGRTIKQFHDACVYHADLNARNILLNKEGRVFVIDFDKGEKQPVDSAWQQANIERLQRSLNKFKTNEAQFYFDEQAWQALLNGYQDR